MARPKTAFCTICKKSGHTRAYHDTHGPSEGFAGQAYHGHVEGSIWQGNLRKK